MSAALYGRDSAGVNRQIKKLYANVGGVNRELKELWERDFGGVNRKIFSGYDCKASAAPFNDFSRSYFDEDGAIRLEVQGPSGRTIQSYIDFFFNDPIAYASNQDFIILQNSTGHSDNDNEDEHLVACNLDVPDSDDSFGFGYRTFAYSSYPGTYNDYHIDHLNTYSHSGTVLNIRLGITASLHISGGATAQFYQACSTGNLYIGGKQIHLIETI